MPFPRHPEACKRAADLQPSLLPPVQCRLCRETGGTGEPRQPHKSSGAQRSKSDLPCKGNINQLY